MYAKCLALVSLVGLLAAAAAPEAGPEIGGGRDYLSDPERDHSTSTRLVLAAVAAERGMRVVDVGAGVGYFTFKFASAVGPEGRVEATDVDPAALEILKQEATRRNETQVVATLVQAEQLGATSTPVDVIALVNSYRFDLCPENAAVHIDYLIQCYEALSAGGRLIVHRDWRRTTAWRAPGRSEAAECDDATRVDVAVWATLVGFDMLWLEPLDYQQSQFAGEFPGYQLALRRE